MVNLAQNPVPCRRPAWGAALAAAVIVVTPPTLTAQKLTDPAMPVPHTSRRQPQREPPAAADDGWRFQMHEVWRVGAAPEMLLAWYRARLNWMSPVKDGRLDTADVRLGDTRPSMSYHLTFHTFEDQCADSGETTSAARDGTRPCTRWKLGKDKRRLLSDNRIGFEQGVWLERITFTWMTREFGDELVRRRIEVRDAGPSDDWKRYTLVTEITLDREVLRPATSSP